jgi:ribosomal protein L34E
VRPADYRAESFRIITKCTPTATLLTFETSKERRAKMPATLKTLHTNLDEANAELRRVNHPK